MNDILAAERELGRQSARARAKALLTAYPNIDAAETAEIADFLRTGPVLEVGLLSSDEELRPKLLAFQAEHEGRFALRAKDYLVVALITAVLAVVCFLLWDAGV